MKRIKACPECKLCLHEWAKKDSNVRYADTGPGKVCSVLQGVIK
ncbi:hypothetical protein [Methanomethylovorans sp.]